MGTNLKKRLLPLDSLRGIAACIIAFFWHYQHFGYVAGDASQPFFDQFGYFYLRGWNLVDLFFVLSGFVIMYTYSERLLEGHITLKKYLVKRLSRVYPLHFITLCLVAILQLSLIAWAHSAFIYGNTDVYHFFLNLLLLQRGLVDFGYSFNGPSWVISLLIYMYILFFFVITKTKSNRYLAFVCLALLGLISIKTGWPDRDIARATLGFFTGCLTYGIYTLIHLRSRPRDFVMWVAAAFALGIVLDAKAALSTFIVFGYSLPIFVWPAIILTVLSVPLLYRISSIKPLVYLGQISYSIFLIHFPIQLVMLTVIRYFDFDMRSVYVFYIYIASTLLLSSLSHKYLELPLQHILRKEFVKQ